MKVEILEPSGYCVGVEHAMKVAIETKDKNPSRNVVVLGMLVHNQDSLKELEKHGIKTIYKQNCSLEQLVDEIREPSIVILTAHGHAKAVEEKLIKNGHEIVDATCPFVKQSFVSILKAVESGKDVLYIGVKNHPESVAALSLSNKVHLIDIKEGIINSCSFESPSVISQTTLSRFEVGSLYETIKAKYPNADFLEGICNASTKRQESLMNLSDDIDLIYIVGGANSNNSKTLFELALKLYPNKQVKLIQNANDINKKDHNGLSHIAISSGASTPKEVINEIKDKLLN